MDATGSASASASASMSRPAAPTAFTVADHVHHVRERQTDVDAFANLITQALLYVDHGAGKKVHPFCSTGGPPDFELHSSMLRCFGFRAKDEVETWQRKVAHAIYGGGCVACYQGYLRARVRLRTAYLDAFPADKIDGLLDLIDAWEQDLALDALKRKGIAPGTGLAALSPAETYAVLSLVASDRAQQLRQQVKAALTTQQLPALTELPAGLLVLAVDDDPTARAFAARQMIHLKPLTTPMAENPVFDRAIAAVASKLNDAGYGMDWSTVPMILRVLPRSAAALTPAILNHVHDRGAHLPDVLRAYTALLKQRGPAIWQDLHGRVGNDGGDDEYPTLVLSGILDNPFFTQPLLQHPKDAPVDARQRTLYFSWMGSHLASLRHAEQDIQGPHYVEALKRLANFLFERMQQGHVPNAYRSVSLKEAVDLVLNHADERSSRDVVDLYAPTIASMALGKGAPDADTRAAARDLMRQAFERDAKALVAASEALAALTVKYTGVYKLHSRARRDPKVAATMEVLSPGDIYKQAMRDGYPSLSICSELWHEAYSALETHSGGEAYAVFLQALAPISVYMAPSASTHLLREADGHGAAFEAYAARVKASVASISKALATMRGGLADKLTDFGELATEDDAQSLCVGSVHSLLLLNLCPDVEVHKSAQNLLRQAFPDVQTRADCFRVLLQINTSQALRGLVDFLHAFVSATTKLVEANDLAKWMVRSFANILSVLCDGTDGLLCASTPGSLVEDRGKRQSVALKLPALWQAMCRSVSSIFRKTPQWSTLLAREDMVAWFRDVTIFASEMVDALSVFRPLVSPAGDADDRDLDSSDEDAMTLALAQPLESAISWLRMNDQEILTETRGYIERALERFARDAVDFPADSKRKLLDFINQQLAIDDPKLRHTLLSDEELGKLKQLVDPPIEISDSDDDGGGAGSLDSDGESAGSELGRDKNKVRESSRPIIDSSHWWSSAGLYGTSLTSSQGRKKKQQQQQQQKLQKKKLKQQKLSFANVPPSKIIDVDAAYSGDAKAPSKSKAAAAPPKAPAAPINAYKGAAARAAQQAGTKASSAASASRSAVPKAGTGKLAQLRQELGTSRSWRPQNVNARPPAAPARSVKDGEAGTLQSSSVTGVAGGKTTAAGKPNGATASSASSSSSDDSSDEEAEAKGLAALSKRRSPLRPRMPLQPQPRRQIKVLEDPAISRAKQERQEAERKRLLRSAPDYSALHRSILAWDYYHEGQRPPVPAGKEPAYRMVPSLLANAAEYGQVFGPLLLLECWAQFQQAREEADSVPDRTTVEVVGRATVDQFVDLNATIVPAAVPKTFSLNETEVVRLKELYPPPGRRPRTMLAKVQAFKRHPQGHLVTLRCCLIEDKQGINSNLTARTKWELTKLFSLTTLHREFAALMTAAYFDLFQNVLAARVSPKAPLSAEKVQHAMNGYQVNEPQARAILGSLATPGFSLIQGPPGTGKTKTICALIGAFISTRKGTATSAGGGGGGSAAGGPCKKILLCAPSNAAIDEVAKRAKAGMRNAEGKTIYPRVVRLGREEGINVAVKDISLDHLIEQRLSNKAARDQDKPAPVDPSILHAEIHALKKQREDKQAELSAVQNNPALATQLQAEIRNLAAKRLAVMSKLDEAKDRAQTEYRQQEADRRKARTEILADADVICSTLSGAGHEMLNSLPFDFETVVVDEAAQAVELSTIIPLRYGCKQCILVGDPNQLPPTVISQQAEQLRYSQSLFVRMFERSPDDVYLLSIQYRMHPEISVFPSATFYGSKLKDGPNMAQLTTQPWHRYELTRPFKFFSTKAAEMPGRAHSLINREEANVALAIYERLRQDYPQTDLDYRVGIVTMYKAQLFELKRTFAARYGQDIHHTIDFNTVDGFQGQEKDIIILSCVRSSGEARSIGFLGDRRRVNVAITRAKSNLFVVGNADHLSRSDPLWQQLVATARERQALQNVTVATFTKTSKTVLAKVAPPEPMPSAGSRAPPPGGARPGGVPTVRPRPVSGSSATGAGAGSTPSGPKASPRAMAQQSQPQPQPQPQRQGLPARPRPPPPVASSSSSPANGRPNGTGNGAAPPGDPKKRKGIIVRDEVPDVLAAKKRKATDADGISYGVPAGQAGRPNPPPPAGAAAPVPPSDAALNSLFVKKRR
ncbi:uncharacterized protein PFL1_03984 [Pseudozyma flocculosa PF-1]|uniref:SEN1 N terminal-domain-containing protein n=1 Tax=Pseudozyma flocculosa PF-1 TaxID=1277687 RepID=A0A061HDH8_9BASI|nr:uncharacterized protein PFL1_03984 [Pseudozyma flocculosa PF-1]EPQ28681.1 hypothetical protein PFL1_03984 [Pseudozyma flocculosa PF-1]